jgi:hypothetical protein
LRTEGYSDLQYAFRSDELRAIEPFDAARTWEYGRHDLFYSDRGLIVSQRFYRFCVKHKLKGEWVPVLVVE